jgi:predicted RNA-binding protein with PUA-like domain
MKTRYWLVKQEPESYAWDTFVKDGRTSWDGVRNYQARNNLRLMRPGDRVLFYASGGPKEVVGTARVSRAAYPDPTADDATWVSVEIEAGDALRKPVSLIAIRSEPGLSGVPLLRHTRLSVMPLSRQEFEGIVALGA